MPGARVSSKSSPSPDGARQATALVVLVVICLLAGYVGSIATTPNIPTWYAGLTKPFFTPPNAVFPIVWTLLYLTMAVAAWLVWRQPQFASERRAAFAAFFVQLALNVVWSWVFFGTHNAGAGLIAIFLLLAAIAWTIATFWRVSRVAAWMLAPYAGWVAFATLLNGGIYLLN
jgi:translocator protein